MSDDALQRFLFLNHDIKSAFVRMPNTVLAIMQQHHYPPPVYQALGECLIAVVLLSHSIKFKGDITLQLESGGSITLLVAKSSHDFAVRGLANFDKIADSEQLCTDFKDGRLVITIQQADQARPMQSIVELQGHSVAEALEYYFLQSEQLPTALRINVTKDHAAGVLLQRLPQPKPDNAEWSRIVQCIRNAADDVMALPCEELITTVFPEDDIELYPALPVRFECHCSLKKMENAVKTLGREDAEQLLREKQTIVVVCEYCNTEYPFSRGEVDKLFDNDADSRGS